MKQFKTSLRTLYKFRLYSIVNILGLAVSLACVIIIARYVHQETTVNSFVDELDRTYVMSSEGQSGQRYYIGVYGSTADEIVQEQVNNGLIEDISTFIPYESDYIHIDDNQYNTKLIVADNKFLKILPYPLLYGNNFSENPNETILTETFANKLFGRKNPIGESFTFSNGEILKVVGVISEPSSKSFLEFDLLVNYNLRTNWDRMDHNLILLDNNNDYKKVNRNIGVTTTDDWNKSSKFQLVPLKEFYFDRSRTVYQEDDPIFIQGNIDNVKILSLVALVILIIGLFNFINTYTVIAMKRGRELSIKKVYGASLWQTAKQIWIENAIVVSVSLIIAWFLLEVTATVIKSRLGFAVMPNLSFDIGLSAIVLAVLPILVSIYPYFRYKRSAPVRSLNAIGFKAESTVIRKGFLFLQYMISFGLLIVSIFFMKQLNFMLNTKPGYNTEDIIVTKMIVDNHLHQIRDFEEQQKAYRITQEKMLLVKDKLDESPIITDWIIDQPPIYALKSSVMFRNSEQSEYNKVALKFASREYLVFFDFQLAEGRLWDATDEFAQYKCIINKSAKQNFNISDIYTETLQPETRLWMSAGEDHSVNPAYKIVGVIEDFNIGHLSKKTPPLIITFTESKNHGTTITAGNTMPIMAKFAPGRKEEAVAYIESIYKEVNDNADFTYTLLDEEITQLYDEDKRVSNIIALFALLAIVISSMGLFALSLFEIQQRYREIALRKINGATAKDIMQLLLKKYLYLLAGAFVVAVPVSYFAISKYLEGFAHKASISWWLFALAAVVVSAISLLTLVWQIKRAMKINPANALQSE